MPSRTDPARHKRRPAAIRQSVTIPASLAADVRRVAKERGLTLSKALVTLAERGVEAEAAARESLEASRLPTDASCASKSRLSRTRRAGT
jgi:hypothetical protein